MSGSKRINAFVPYTNISDSRKTFGNNIAMREGSESMFFTYCTLKEWPMNS